MSDIIW